MSTRWIYLGVAASTTSRGRRVPGVGRAASSGAVVWLLAGVTPPAIGQCSWSGPSTGPAGPVVAMVAFDPDGPGPALESLVVGGLFATAAGQPAVNVAVWNGSSWTGLGLGLNGEVKALAVYQGQLMAGGKFTLSGQTPVAYLARWTGSAWVAFASEQPTGDVLSLAVQGSSLIVAGGFQWVGGLEVDRIARWNGAAWSGFGLGADGVVNAVLPEGAAGVYAVGAFEQIGEVGAARAALWTGSAWVAYGSGMNGDVRVVKPAPDGSLVAGGGGVVGHGVSRYRVAVAVVVTRRLAMNACRSDVRYRTHPPIFR